MSNYALIENEVVQNIIVATRGVASQIATDQNMIAVNVTNRECGKGWYYTNNIFWKDEEWLKNYKKKQINNVRYSKIYSESIPYTFPGDTEPDGIQMRDETDRQNIQDFYADAITNEPDVSMTWMPTSNTPKTMTAAQVIEMGKALKARGDNIMAYSWQLKAQIDAGIEVDINEGWPE